MCDGLDRVEGLVEVACQVQSLIVIVIVMPLSKFGA